MTHLLIDTSVLIKWFHAAGETELAESRALRAAHISGLVEAHMLDLGIYEIGNVLGRTLRWQPDDVADQIEDLQAILGAPILMTRAWLRRAAHLADRHSLTFYDACWAAAAEQLKATLVSSDRQLVAAGLAESPTSTVARLRLAP